ncbi:MAG TPA: LacI family DNA-binding transcriptional regulator [Bacillota bacterium]|nr:LacI family DNA-binding transcriptional regulator [Bacillota bacterium]
MSKKSIGIREIAQLSGVSIATVSRVINGAPNTSEKTRRKVNEVIEKYHYIPNITAKNMFSKSSKSIAMFVLDLDNPFFVSLVKALNKIAFENGYALLICNTENNPQKELEYLEYCEGIRTKGVIFTEGYNNNVLWDKFQNQTFVFHDRQVSEKYSSVKSDNEKGIRMLVDYLVNLNHRQIGFAGFDPKTKSILERKRAYTASLEEKGIPLPPEYIFAGEVTARGGANAFDYFCSLTNPPTAIICANDQLARGFIARANMIGMRVPDDFSLVGFDGCNTEYFYPRITTIRQDTDLLAQRLFECVVASPNDPKNHVIDVSLVIGDSCKKLNG